ncbi:DUF1257 domain-containing protein [Desulfatibacillum aliphaticivorans]|uniref:DUF1257 domain-containing protein n=1 Tax=Desulfatibacillum aliphaticivorans TaxID=218208 RepID=UPI00048853DA|nr:DUF1257 domain-containing protein [Desulfatibacillum aliphaticivorans]
MSHISKIEVRIDSLDALKLACHRLGFQFNQNQTTYKWFGRWVGDEPLPEGVSEEELGKCHHAIIVPECEYEIGVVKRESHYILLWDSWYRGGLKKKIGKNAGILKQAYSIEKIRAEARKRSYRITEKRTPQGIRLTLTC